MPILAYLLVFKIEEFLHATMNTSTLSILQAVASVVSLFREIDLFSKRTRLSLNVLLQGDQSLQQQQQQHQKIHSFVHP